jgi:hypothetical protein
VTENQIEIIDLEKLIKYELVYFSDCRWISEIYDYKDMMCDRGVIDVVDFIVEERMEEDESWVESVGSFLNEEDWISGKEAGVNLVGGDILKYWSKCIIELKNERGKRQAILRKHRSLKEGVMDFEIDNLGIKKRGWL